MEVTAEERERLEELYNMEKELKKRGYTFIAGVDEAGRGPLAGPVVAGAAILALDTQIIDLKDSKKLSEKKRKKVYDQIKKHAIAFSYDVVDEKYIDKHNILNATLFGMRRAVEKLPIKPDYILVDALTIPGMSIPQQGIKRGDDLCACIAAASIIAKVERDELMKQYDKAYPGYFFSKNKGYGTKQHVEAIRKNGYCPIHRHSFSVKGLNV